MSIKIGTLKPENDLSVDEVRILYDTEGNVYRIIMPKSCWKSYDMLLITDTWNEQSMVDLIKQDAALNETPVEEFFQHGITQLHNMLYEATQKVRGETND